MILEGFEIENWACIKKLVVSGLPPTGVIVNYHLKSRPKGDITITIKDAKGRIVRKLTSKKPEDDQDDAELTLDGCYPAVTA